MHSAFTQKADILSGITHKSPKAYMGFHFVNILSSLKQNIVKYM